MLAVFGIHVLGLVEAHHLAGHLYGELQGSKRVMRRTPLTPLRLAAQNASLPIPFGLTAPIPVITTRRFICAEVLPLPIGQYRLISWAMVRTRTKIVRHCLLPAWKPASSPLYLLGWLALASAWYRRSIWTTANIMATTFSGEAAWPGFHSRTVAGLALYLVLYGIIGALFGLTLASRDASLRILDGVCGLGWYYLSFALLRQTSIHS